jgi:hypothetical protein
MSREANGYVSNKSKIGRGSNFIKFFLTVLKKERQLDYSALMNKVVSEWLSSP